MKIHEKLYFDEHHLPIAIKEDARVVENNYVLDINCFYLELELIVCWPNCLFFVPIELVPLYEKHWKLLYTKGFNMKEFDLKYGLFRNNETWFRIFATEWKNFIMNSKKGKLKGWFSWIKRGCNWGLHFISEEKPENFFN